MKFFSKKYWDIGKWYISFNEGGIPNCTIDIKKGLFYMCLRKVRIVFGKDARPEYKGIHSRSHIAKIREDQLSQMAVDDVIEELKTQNFKISESGKKLGLD